MEKYLKLKKKKTKRRIVETIASVLALIALITFITLKDNTKVVNKVYVTEFLSYDTFSYSDEYDVSITISSIIFTCCITFLLSDLLAARVYYQKIDGQDIIIYNGIGPVRLLVNDVEKDAMVFKSYLQAKLESGVTMVVSAQFFMSYHITFSDNRPAIDL